MKSKKIKLIILLFFIITSIDAQEATDASGGDATGSGGTVAFSIGQIDYTINTGTTGSAAQGVQQPYTIINIGLNNETDLLMSLTLFPNPTTDILNLNIQEYNTEKLSYQLTDAIGKLISEKKIVENFTKIELISQVNAIYFLNIIKNNQIVKTFKIIKN
jgi:hypothetical protein